MRAELLGGRNPANKNPLVGKPLALNTTVKAQGPGNGITGIFDFLQARTRRNPGSLRPGVPASLTTATDLPAAICWIKYSAA